MKTVEWNIDYFFSRSIPEPNSGCWIWLGARTGRDVGYGSIRKKGKTYVAHRALFETIHGVTLPQHLDVCHRCDIRECVNPEHLFLGTRSDNMQDCVKKNRLYVPRLRGEMAGGAKLTENDVTKIRADIRSAKVMASIFGVDKSTIKYIRQRVTWRHI